MDGEKMAVLCRRFGVSRKTGYKILERYNSCGLEGLTDRSRRPYRHANQLPIQIETLIVRSSRGAVRVLSPIPQGSGVAPRGFEPSQGFERAAASGRP
jgi:leucine-zipper of insertion element IS481